MIRDGNATRLLDGRRFLAPFTMISAAPIATPLDLGHATSAFGSFAELQDPALALVICAGNVKTTGGDAFLTLRSWDAATQAWVQHGQAVPIPDTSGTWQDFACGFMDPAFPLGRRTYAVHALPGLVPLEVRGITAALVALPESGS